jgi:hypothetical protein
MKQGDIVIYNNKECVINGILYMYDKEPQYTLKDLKSGLGINGFVSMDEMEKVEKFALGGYAIPYSYKPKYADGKTKKDIEDLGRNSFGEFDSDEIPASTMQIDANVSYDEAKERVEEELKERFEGILEVDDFWIGDADIDVEKRVRVRTDIPSEEPELKEIERSGKWDDSYSRLCDELATYAKGGEVMFHNVKDRGRRIWENYKNINNQQSVGSFSHNYNKRNVGDYYLFLLDDYDRKFYSHISLKPNEMLFRFETERGRISKSLPLIKINLQNGRVYFMSDDNDINSDYDDKNPKFQKASADINYLSLDDRIREYIQGLITYDELSESVDKTYAKGGSTYAEGGEIKVGDKVKMFKDEPFLIIKKVNEFADKGNTYSLASEDGKIKRNNISHTKIISTYAEGGEVYNAHILTNDNKLIHRRYPKKITHNEIYKEYKYKGVEIKDSQIHFAKPIDFFDKLREETKKYVRENMNDDVDSENIFISSMQKGNEYIATEIKGDTISGKSFTITPKDLFEVGFKGNLYAKGGNVAKVKTMVYSQSGEFNLEEYQDLSNEDMMGESPMGIEEVKAKVFAYNEEAYDYEDEINEIEDVDDLAELLYDSGLAQRYNTYNKSWWGGVRLYAILNNNGDNFDLDYPTILFMSRHRGGDVRGNYEKYEAFDIEQYGYEQIPFMSATRLTYEVTDGDKKAVFETEDMEGYELYVVESDFVDFDEGDSTNMDEVGEKLGVELY